MADRSHPLRPSRTVPLIVAAGLALSACTDTRDSVAGGPEGTGSATTAGNGTGTGSGGDTASVMPDLPPRLILDVPDPNSIYDPVRGGETLPEGFRQLLSRDAIAPVYDPAFVTAAGVDWPEDSLVIGVDLEGEARAYPVGFLNRREIVNDNHRGIPTLVTW